jgi:hypothetical protein
MTLYKGIRFLPKQLSSFSNGSNDSQLGTPAKKDSSKQLKVVEKDLKAIAANNSTASNHQPKIVNSTSSTQKPTIHLNTTLSMNDGSKKMPVLTRSTPGKSASFKQQNDTTQSSSKSRGQTLIANIKSNFMKSKPSSSSSSNASKPSGNSSANTSKLNSYNSEKDLNVSSSKKAASSSNKSSGMLSSFHLRKKSENNKPINTSTTAPSNSSSSNPNTSGFLRTEIRAMKRSEYEQSIKEKEKMACIIKNDLEQEKMRKQKEEVNRIRSKSQFRVEPIKKYKPIEIKPSEKQLTRPKSPQFNLSNNTSTQFHNLSHSHATNKS